MSDKPEPTPAPEARMAAGAANVGHGVMHAEPMKQQVAEARDFRKAIQAAGKAAADAVFGVLTIDHIEPAPSSSPSPAR